MSFELWAVLLAMVAASFWVFEIIQLILVVRQDWNMTPPTYVPLKKWAKWLALFEWICNLFIGLWNLIQLLAYSIMCIVAVGRGVVKSPGFAIDIIATIGFTAMFSGAGASILGTVVGLAISNIFSLGIMVWGLMNRRTAMVA